MVHCRLLSHIVVISPPRKRVEVCAPCLHLKFCSRENFALYLEILQMVGLKGSRFSDVLPLNVLLGLMKGLNPAGR